MKIINKEEILNQHRNIVKEKYHITDELVFEAIKEKTEQGVWFDVDAVREALNKGQETFEAVYDYEISKQETKNGNTATIRVWVELDKEEMKALVENN